jgi:hypothetical protein
MPTHCPRILTLHSVLLNKMVQSFLFANSINESSLSLAPIINDSYSGLLVTNRFVSFNDLNYILDITIYESIKIR